MLTKPSLFYIYDSTSVLDLRKRFKKFAFQANVQIPLTLSKTISNLDSELTDAIPKKVNDNVTITRSCLRSLESVFRKNFQMKVFKLH